MIRDPAPITIAGDPERAATIIEALAEVVDPEMSLDIVALGLIYGVTAAEREVVVTMTMTSAACPVAELIVADIEERLAAQWGDDMAVRVAIVWEPPWSPERMSAGARSAMGWD